MHAYHQSDQCTHATICLLGYLLGIVFRELVGLQPLQFGALGLAETPKRIVVISVAPDVQCSDPVDTRARAAIDVDNHRGGGRGDCWHGIAGPDTAPVRTEELLPFSFKHTRVRGIAADARAYIIVQRTVILVARAPRALYKRTDIRTRAREPHAVARHTDRAGVG